VRAVHADAQRLVKIGLIDKTEDGKLLFPYSGVHLDLDWCAAA
jgi:predicted transcriptional regulator